MGVIAGESQVPTPALKRIEYKCAHGLQEFWTPCFTFAMGSGTVLLATVLICITILRSRLYCHVKQNNLLFTSDRMHVITNMLLFSHDWEAAKWGALCVCWNSDCPRDCKCDLFLSKGFFPTAFFLHHSVLIPGEPKSCLLLLYFSTPPPHVYWNYEALFMPSPKSLWKHEGY